MQLDITPKRVTSEENRADSLSRGLVEGHKEDLRVLFPVPPDLEDAIECTYSIVRDSM